MRYLPAVLTVILLTTACSWSETDRVTGTIIGPEGGTVTGPDNVWLQIPQGALDREVEITVEKASGSPTGFHPTGDIYEFGPAGTVFAAPVTVSLPYDESLVLGAETAVRVWWSLSMNGTWGPLEGSADTAQNTVTGLATHFSFGGSGEPDGGCQPDCAGRDCGPDPVCGTDCGACDPLDICTPEGRCATVVCDLRVSPGSVGFGTVKPGYTSTGTFTIQSIGTDDCTVSNIEYRPSLLDPSEFFLTNAQTPLVINRPGQPNSTFLLEVTFAPTQTGTHTGAVVITADDPDLQQATGSLCDQPPPELGQACVWVIGSCAESYIEVIPAQIDFGLVGVGCNSIGAFVNVFNMDAATLNITDLYLGDPGDLNFEIASAPALPIELAGGANVQIHMRYHPQDAGPHGGMLYIESDATNAALLSVPLLGQGTAVNNQTDTFHQPDRRKVDILFVVDNSGSMGEEQTALANNFDSFIQYAITMDSDYHVGVIATEVNDAETGVGSPSRDIFPGVLVQAPGCPKIITENTPDVSGCFADNVNLGTCCSDEQEAGLQAAWMALTPPLVDDPISNAGFLRDESRLYVIMVSDEEDQSSGTVEFYLEFFESIKGPRNTDMMKVSAICGDSPDGCLTADAGSRYIEMATRTGGNFESICTSDWAQSLQNLGIAAFCAIREFPLSRQADPASVQVAVDSIPAPQASCEGCTDGWTYFPDTNTVYFGDDVVPGPGSLIEISYLVACL